MPETEQPVYTTDPGNEEHHLTDAELRTLVATPGRWSQPLAREVLELRASLAAIKAVDPDLFDPSGGTSRGAAYETYGTPGHRLREAYLAAIGITLEDDDA